MPNLQREAVYLGGLLHEVRKQYLLVPKRISEETTLQEFIQQLFTKEQAGMIQQWLPTDEASDKQLQQIVNNANDFASGKQAKTHENTPSPDVLQVASIFEAIKKGEGAAHQYFLPLISLSLEEHYFPMDDEVSNTTAENAQIHLWEAFTKELHKIHIAGFAQFFTTLLTLLHKYTGTLPCSAPQLPDVSLYDQAKTTAAFAVCLYDYHIAPNTAPNFVLTEEDNPVLLVGGDVSGIQKFIYDIISSDAAKNLKGRSFYLQLLVDNIVQSVLDKLGLLRANIVYASGGGFYLLAPHTTKVIEDLAALEYAITQSIFEQHGTSLFLALDSTPVTLAQIYGLANPMAENKGKAQQQAANKHEISTAWQTLTQKLARKKRQRYQGFFVDSGFQNPLLNYEAFFEPTPVNGDEERDRITNEIIRGEKKYIDEDITKPVSLKTQLQIDLGKNLRKTDYLVITQKEVPEWKDNDKHFCIPMDMAESGDSTYHYFIKETDRNSGTMEALENSRIVGINRLDLLITQNLDKQVLANEQLIDFYGGNRYPAYEGKALNTDGSVHHWPEQIKNFDDLAGSEDVSLKRLGILRMDVDSLGQIFINGFDGQPKTFSRYSTLSRSLDYFFKGFLNSIWDSREDFQNNTYILYAGGDDLFIVGKWNFLIDFAEAIQQYYEKWTCHNPNLSLSGGIAIVGAKFPIAKGASMAEDAEKAAKSHICEGLEKNAFTLLDSPLHWKLEFPIVKTLKDELVRFIKNENKLSKVLLSKIQYFTELRTLQKAKQKNESWKWLLAYDFGRAGERLKEGDKEEKEFLQNLKIGIFTDNWQGKKINGEENEGGRFLQLLSIAARWAELEMRA